MTPMSGTDAKVRRPPFMLAALTVAACVVAFAISPFALVRLGINYSDTGGFLLEKIHPATYLMTAALFARLVLDAHPSRFLVAAIERHFGATILLWMVVTLIAYVVVNLHVPLSLVIDTFIFPILALFLLDGIDERTARLLAWLIHLIFAANAVLGLVEMATGWRLTPIVLHDLDLTTIEPRSSAIFGHPLGNAMFTGLYIVMMAIGGGRDLPGLLRFPAMLLQIVGIFSFGGRAATVTMLALVLLIGLGRLAGLLQGRRFRTRSAAIYLSLLPVMIGAVFAAYAAGFFDLLLDRFVSDERSAQARVIMFEMFAHFTWFQLLFGPDQDLLRALSYTEGIEFGIESFWVSFPLTYGLVPSLFFFLAFGCFLLDLARQVRKGIGWVLAYFLIVISGSLSIGDKTLALGVLVILSMILLRRPAAERAEFPWPIAVRRGGQVAAPAGKALVR